MGSEAFSSSSSSVVDPVALLFAIAPTPSVCRRRKASTIRARGRRASLLSSGSSQRSTVSDVTPSKRANAARLSVPRIARISRWSIGLAVARVHRVRAFWEHQLDQTEALGEIEAEMAAFDADDQIRIGRSDDTRVSVLIQETQE